MASYRDRVADYLNDPFFPVSADPIWRRPFVVVAALWFALWNADDYREEV